ncbi:hypothetical protein HPB48_009261 [Haemaphysalis longicornis]|uniref:Peptidase M13 C-terminal domain-containing protein n=1 Tax=Haemaphysalis longicornis TaxID=44386 RepID=A0A9J6GFA0_HAELO|nr:hypothetical protein HPB48_009261 [Haemaphysalis longicornis]
MSVFDTLAKYDRHTNKVYVPLGIVNYSTPVNSTEFAIHAARYAVRFFKALVPVLYPNYARTLGQRRDSWLYSKQYQGRFEAAVDCLLTQYHNTNEDLKSTFLRTLADRTSAGPALMEQTLALMQAYSAFKELLNNQSTQRSNFQLAGQLQGGTPEQLFFVAYAQDNCDTSDNVHRRRQFHADISQLPPEDRVNFPLTQLEAFARAFACNHTESMVANKRCPIIRAP